MGIESTGSGNGTIQGCPSNGEMLKSKSDNKSKVNCLKRRANVKNRPKNLRKVKKQSPHSEGKKNENNNTNNTISGIMSDGESKTIDSTAVNRDVKAKSSLPPTQQKPALPPKPTYISRDRTSKKKEPDNRLKEDCLDKVVDAGNNKSANVDGPPPPAPAPPPIVAPIKDLFSVEEKERMKRGKIHADKIRQEQPGDNNKIEFDNELKARVAERMQLRRDQGLEDDYSEEVLLNVEIQEPTNTHAVDEPYHDNVSQESKNITASPKVPPPPPPPPLLRGSGNGVATQENNLQANSSSKLESPKQPQKNAKQVNASKDDIKNVLARLKPIPEDKKRKE